jgi:hypothetical protein
MTNEELERLTNFALEIGEEVSAWDRRSREVGIVKHVRCDCHLCRAESLARAAGFGEPTGETGEEER